MKTLTIRFSNKVQLKYSTICTNQVIPSLMTESHKQFFFIFTPSNNLSSFITNIEF